MWRGLTTLKKANSKSSSPFSNVTYFSKPTSSRVNRPLEKRSVTFVACSQGKPVENVQQASLFNSSPVVKGRISDATPSSRRNFSSSSSGVNTNAIEVVDAGMYSLIQDYPGRIALWRVGVPPSGPMDHFAFRVANKLVGNEENQAALELTYLGPTIKFSQDTAFALTGAHMIADLDGKAVPYWKTVHAKAGSVLAIKNIEGGGSRSYLAVSGGFDAPEYLGSRSTFPLGGIGGANHPKGRPLQAGDQLKIGTPSKDVHKINLKLEEELIPKYSSEWEIQALPGPQEAPDYFTEEDIKNFYSTNWEISHNASRLGVRLNGPRPNFTRPDGGEGGSHPSNLHDNAYAIGAINFTGDHPVALMVDGPSLGGFVCPAVVPDSEIWKFGQVKPNDVVKFKKINLNDALANNFKLDQSIGHLKTYNGNHKPYSISSSSSPSASLGKNAVLKVKEATASTPRVEYRLAGDKHILVEYGALVLDMNLRVRIHLLEQWLRSQKLKGLIDTIPGVRSLLIQYDYKKLGLQDLLEVLDTAEKEIPDPRTQKIRSRVFNLPLAFKDRWTRAAIDKYMSTVRGEAPYLPDNIEFIARSNGLSSGEEVRKMIFDTSYMVAGLGDVYLGAPCAFPLDPRQKLVVPKYNPARTFTPEGAVGIGGCYMCIYPMESPGGYQLIGRTLPIWNTEGNIYPFAKDKPWLLDMFDQVRYYQVTEDELEKQRAAFPKGELKLQIEEEVFDVQKYNEFLGTITAEVDALKERQKKHQAIELQRDAEMLARAKKSEDGAQKITNYLATMVVKGPDHPGAVGPEPSKMNPIIPNRTPNYPQGDARSSLPPPRGLKQVLQEKGPAGFAEAVRKHKGLLLTDTTWRDAHQSLLATRVRTHDMAVIAPSTAHVLANCYSIECWGGATFDVALRFLHEDPWERLAKLRELVPNVPFQMLLRGANALGYSNYPDNVIYKFCKKSVETGMDVFRVFDSLNYVENLKIGIDAVGAAGGVVEAVICYTGDLTDPKKSKYNLEYYLNLARQLVNHGIHVLCIKDMAGLLKPRAATLLISTLRKEFPNLPIHIHTHDTASTGVASMIACYEAGADAVDCCSDALSGLTSQPSMGAIVGNFGNSQDHTGVDLNQLQHLTTYWEGVRRLYSPFESGQKSAGHDVYLHEIPGGQYTNMLFQALSLGLASEWDAIKIAYHQANNLVGNIVKVTPSSKVVGDLAQFMVANKLDEKSCLERADQLDFPNSVIDFLQGNLGQPPGGFPEPFRSRVLKGRPTVDHRPGLNVPPHDFDGHLKKLQQKYPEVKITELDVLSSTQFPQVFEEYMKHFLEFGNVTNLPTRPFLTPLQIGEEVSFTEQGKQFNVKLIAVKDFDSATQSIPVQFEINGKSHTFNIKVKEGTVPFIQRTGSSKAAVAVEAKERANSQNPGSLGAPMPGKVVEIKAKVGDVVKKGDTIVVLSAMKMETVVRAPLSGTVTRVVVKQDDSISAGDLILEITP